MCDSYFNFRPCQACKISNIAWILKSNSCESKGKKNCLIHSSVAFGTGLADKNHRRNAKKCCATSINSLPFEVPKTNIKEEFRSCD